MNRQNKIDYVELPAADLAQMKRFYRQVFGWEFTDYGEDYTAFCQAGLAGGFFHAEQASSTASGAALLVIFSTDLAQTQRQIVEAGGQICRDIFSFPGGRRFHFLDPNGNELAVWAEG